MPIVTTDTEVDPAAGDGHHPPRPRKRRRLPLIYVEEPTFTGAPLLLEAVELALSQTDQLAAANQAMAEAGIRVEVIQTSLQ